MQTKSPLAFTLGFRLLVTQLLMFLQSITGFYPYSSYFLHMSQMPDTPSGAFSSTYPPSQFTTTKSFNHWITTLCQGLSVIHFLAAIITSLPTSQNLT